MIVLGESAHSGAFVNFPMGVGASGIGSVLSFSATIFGFAAGWTSYAADYTVYQKVSGLEYPMIRASPKENPLSKPIMLEKPSTPE